jgi:hypothetical protein
MLTLNGLKANCYTVSTRNPNLVTNAFEFFQLVVVPNGSIFHGGDELSALSNHMNTLLYV